MMCCIIAAILYARMLAALRAWAVYWGITRPLPHEHDAPRLLRNLRGAGPPPSAATGAISLSLVVTLALLAVQFGHGPLKQEDQVTMADSEAASAVPRLSQLIGLGGAASEPDQASAQP
ncbi:hypothetical protein [Novosphingobium mangrovi (ex Huang et al. 2023)]|uniref:Uncharacterized protein n=1 Tax=Novosphingobium mangrovi (ex Huang et al. 2023) TaxID=2976432 RepID=A0ABT2I3C0_9SPHN|nr:hypothetical protein [Novosphingobium mangrovi (ex Huang et al. 2023)]MCT2399307.1 hypothetical protein [Novosphingobium mangrovi (ex Huang et al. 2023)]